METFTLGIAFFTMIVISLVTIIMFAKSKLVSSGDVTIRINGEKTVTVPAGGKLLQTLAGEKCRAHYTEVENICLKSSPQSGPLRR